MMNVRLSPGDARAGPNFCFCSVGRTVVDCFLAGLWTVLFQVVKTPGNPVPDFSKYLIVTVVSILGMAALVSSVAEETGFLGYFQSALEAQVNGPAAGLIAPS